MIKIYNEEVVRWAKEYSGGKFHALLTDTPYNLDTITKRFGKNGSSPAKYGKDGVFQRSSKGFMNQAWDTDVAFQPETWEMLGEHLYPGAFGMAFSGSRTWHRMAVAIEDAGFVIHPTIFGWLNGQGFPKATRISKKNNLDHHPFEGHRYGLQALKPAVEPIIVFQKPYEGKPIDNMLLTGAGALNIDGGRIPVNGTGYIINRFVDGAKPWGSGAGHEYNTEVATQGRWPSNFLFSESLTEQLDSQSGDLPAGTASANSGAMGYHGGRRGSTYEMSYKDNGGASRFFFQVQDQIDKSDPIFYTAKVSPKERSAGLGGFDGKTTDDGRNKPIDNPFLLGETVRKNNHPTVKPISLAKYLATILLPPIEYSPRRILIPFSGVASEMIGAGLAGWEEVVGIEFDKENGYVDTARKRLAHWLNDRGCEIINP